MFCIISDLRYWLPLFSFSVAIYIFKRAGLLIWRRNKIW